jgi:hypothetical protein
MKLVILFFTLVGSSWAFAVDCYAPWGGYVREGQSVLAYKESRPTNGNRCEYQYRTCNNGVLSGWYNYQSCQEDYSCNTVEFGWMQHMSSVIAYLNPQESGGRRCQSEVRTCHYGQLSGSYRWKYCSEIP